MSHIRKLLSLSAAIPRIAAAQQLKTSCANNARQQLAATYTGCIFDMLRFITHQIYKYNRISCKIPIIERKTLL
jgi:hypothetical protein